MARKIEVQLIGDSSSLQRAFSRSSGSGSKWAGRMKTVMKAGGLAIAAGVGAGVVALKSSVDAAKEAELSQGRLRAQLKAAGLNYAKYATQIDKTLESQSKLSAFDDEDLADSFTNIVRITGDVNEALRLNALASDFARAKGMDVAKAGELIGKVAGGNTGILSRYGITLKEGATAQEALGVLQKKFAGQAEAYGKSTAGAQERFGVAVENLQEKIGAKLLPILTRLSEWGIQFIGWAEENWPKFQAAAGEAFDVAREKAQQFIGWFKENVLPTVEAVVDGARKFWNRFGDDIKRNFGAAVTIVKTALNQVKAIIELVMAVIRGDWSEAWAKLKEIARNALTLLVTFLRNFVGNVASAARKIGGALKDGIMAGLRGLASLVGAAVRAAINAAISAFNALTDFSIPVPGPLPDIPVNFPDIPYIAKGGQIARTGVAVVHKGETVVPARVAAAGGGGQVWFFGHGDAGLVAALQAVNTRYQRGNGGRSIF